MKLFSKTKYFVTIALFGLVTSILAPVFVSGAYAADKIVLDPDVKNTAVAGSGYGDTNVSNVNTGDVVRFRIKVNNVSGSTLDSVTVRSYLNKVAANHWTMDAQAEYAEGTGTKGIGSSVSVLLTEDKNLDYVPGSTKISSNGGQPQDIGDVASTSPLLRNTGYTLGNVEAMTHDPQIWLYFDAKVIDGTPNTPQINIEFTKEFRNITKGGTWSTTITADPGDKVQVRIWYHNGGTPNASDKAVRDVIIRDSMDMSPQHNFVNRATFTSIEVGPIVAEAKLNLSEAQGLRYVPGSTKLVVPTSTSNDKNVIFDTGRREAINDKNGTSVLFSEDGYHYGTLQYCWEFQRFVEFELEVSKSPTTPKEEVKAVTTLPKTGPELALVGLIGSSMAGLYLRKFKLWN